ncbi:hypothetical protein ET475_06725 [Microbacterium protaetiae]|uniref:Uncharacterized protein n=1 Tax=Microbacterium protaetiae TaxID=2509458 RepID=A0A4P6EBY6_9MICO|nr:hypothetical protein [Microbacterium protaetiae]QAY59715.1 hypothetical protein ET475_06725 [Microbacterium protaetiae]
MPSHERSRRRDDGLRTTDRLARRPGWAFACWLFVLVAIGVVQIVRLQWFDAAVFFGAAPVATLTATGHLSARGSSHRMPLPALSAAAAVLGAILCFLPRHGVLMQVVVIAIGAIAALVAASGRAVTRPDRPTTFSPGIRRLALAWAVIIVLGCVWELIQFILGLVQPDAAWFALSDLLDPLAGTVPGKILVVAAWLAGGVWLLRRGGRR